MVQMNLRARASPSSSARDSRGRAGLVQELYLVVDDIEVARGELIGCGIGMSEMFHFEGGLHLTGTRVLAPGPDTEGRSYGNLRRSAILMATVGFYKR